LKDLVGREILYSGRVQGVGFRQSVSTLAMRQHVDGFVQNLENGKVRLVVEGECDKVDDLQKDVRTLWGHNISDIQITDLQTIRNFVGFSVRY
jgi:acylphosphatase